MFNSGEAGQNRTARGAVHNNCPVFHVFPFRVPLPVLHPTLVCGSSVLSFIRSLGFPCAIPNTVPAPFRTRCAILLLSIAPADSFAFRVRRWCPVPVLFMLDSIRISPEVLFDACPVTAGRSCILRAVATFVIVSVLLWAYAICCHTGRR